ncbi:nascent polypeptide-associated complex subunit alpha, muscle-specific form-like [Paramacrobiotus metropolitanus]|uniref:nascent polypeptide-associated complex subunit alpha, muscle-specific form-like n=1 Tax=Paramacrobiotus metropolitanus TaxID=2943436 RepID=UPI0024457991|nr:nascent polypeptide-associated complex subunit alpha, muscle-specific form-like [Paramacrobiotus metropolitanus]
MRLLWEILLIFNVLIIPRFVECQGTFGGFGGEVLATHTGGLSRPVGARAPGALQIPNGIADDLVSPKFNTDAPPVNAGAARPAPAPPAGGGAPVSPFNVANEQPAEMPIMPNLPNQFNQFRSVQPGQQFGNQFTSGAQGNSLADSGHFGSGYGGDNDGGHGMPNAGYGGYPGRGGLSGYWEPGVHPVPLAMQGWGLFIPRPPVEITTPTTTVPTTTTTARPTTTTPRPATPAPTPAPVPTPAPTLAPTPAPTTTTTTTPRPTVPTTTMPYNAYAYGNYNMGTYPSVNYPSYSAPAPANYQSYSSGATRNVPQFFMMNGHRVMLTPVEEGGANKEAGVITAPGVQVDVSVRTPTVCTPRLSSTAKGICVSEAQLQVTCSNMIISNSDGCTDNQFCCFSDSNMQ